jgi:hypothetical protein
MTRTVISFSEDDKHWLDETAARQGISMAEVVRRAVKHLRSEEEAALRFKDLLEQTSGIGNGVDGLITQKRLRDEWERRSR